MNQEEIDNENGYLAWISSMDTDHPLEINLTFQDWLSSLIEKKGQEFWL
ncbi:hypothetical protein J2X83_004378 [Brevibacillus nitrificans]|nr:hypothetical protein [Brevibacillus nitrificans]